MGVDSHTPTAVVLIVQTSGSEFFFPLCLKQKHWCTNLLCMNEPRQLCRLLSWCRRQMFGRNGSWFWFLKVLCFSTGLENRRSCAKGPSLPQSSGSTPLRWKRFKYQLFQLTSRLELSSSVIFSVQEADECAIYNIWTNRWSIPRVYFIPLLFTNVPSSLSFNHIWLKVLNVIKNQA